MRIHFIVVSVLICLLAARVVVAERVFVKFGNGVGPIGNASYTAYAKPPVGLFALPLTGGAGVPHTTLFKFAETVIFDAVHQLLVVVRPNNAKGALVYDTATWTDSDLANAAFAPTPLWPLDDTSANNLFLGGSFDFATASDGTPIVIASLDFAPDTRSIIFSTINRVNGQIIPSLRIGETGQYYYYTRYKNLGSAKEPVLFAALDQPPAGASLLVAIELWANFSGIHGVLGAIEMPAEIPNGTYATFLELDATRNVVLTGYGADGVVLSTVTEPSALGYEAHLVVSNASRTYSVGAYQACGRTNAPTSDIAWLNVDSEAALGIRNVTVNLARFTTSGAIALTQEVLTPSSGFVASCGAFATSGGRGVLIVSTTAIDVYDSAVTPAQRRHSVAAPCYESYYVGQLGSYALFFHGDNSTCNCGAAGTPCPLGLEVLGNAAVTSSFSAQFGSHLVDGYHFVQPYTCPSLTILANATLEVHLAQDGNASATQRQEGCGALVNTNLGGAACLVYRGTCIFQDKINNCVAKGATAVIIVNRQGVGLFNPVIDPVNVPVFLVSFEVGEALRLALAAPNTSALPPGLVPVQPVQVNPPLPPTAATTAPPSTSGATPSAASTTGPASSVPPPTSTTPSPTTSSATSTSTVPSPTPTIKDTASRTASAVALLACLAALACLC